MDPNSTADIEHNKAMEFILLINSGLFDRHLTRILNSVTARMATPEWQHYRAPNSEIPPRPLDASDPDSWPTSGLFAPHDGA